MELRSALYAHLAPIANGWMARLGSAIAYPAALQAYAALTTAFVQQDFSVAYVAQREAFGRPIGANQAVAFLVADMKADFGVMISASHNDYADNGIKLFGPDGYKLSDEIELKIEALMDDGLDQGLAPSDKLGRVKRIDDAQARYVEIAKATFPRRLSLSGMRIVIDLHEMLVPDVQAFQVFAHHDEVDIVEAPTGNDGLGWPQVGVQLEFFAQSNVGRAIASARGRFQRPLERKARAANAVEGGLWQRVPGLFDAFETRNLSVPGERRLEGVQGGQRGIDDLRTNAVAGDQGGRDQGGHGIGPGKGVVGVVARASGRHAGKIRFFRPS